LLSAVVAVAGLAMAVAQAETAAAAVAAVVLFPQLRKLCPLDHIPWL